MSKFIEVTICSDGSDNPRGVVRSDETSFIRADWVKEVCPITGAGRPKTEITEDEYEEGKKGPNPDDYMEDGRRYYQLAHEACEVILDFSGATAHFNDRDVHHIYLILAEAAEDFVARVEKAIRDDAVEEAVAIGQARAAPVPAPVHLGYAFAKNNTQVVQATVAGVDGHAALIFAGRAGETVEKALMLAEGFRVEVATADIAINTNPLDAPRHTLVIPGAGNILVSRSADGETLYLLADDAVMAFGIEVLGAGAQRTA